MNQDWRLLFYKLPNMMDLKDLLNEILVIEFYCHT